jgi:hypothetical protein
MLLDTPTARLSLQHNQLARVARACGTRVECVAGVAWITLDRDTRDIVLTRGESFVVDRPTPLLVHAIQGPAAVVLQARHAPCPARRRAPRGEGWGAWWRSVWADPILARA